MNLTLFMVKPQMNAGLLFPATSPESAIAQPDHISHLQRHPRDIAKQGKP
jgi:hypothetical protein